MPIYEYRCKDCETVFETFVTSVSAAGNVRCKKCKSKQVEKQISTCSSRLSGSQGGGLSGFSGGCSSKSGFS